MRTEPAPAPTAVVLVPVYLQGDTDGLDYELRYEDDRLVGRCTSPCTLMVRPARYRVHVEAPAVPSQETRVDVEQSTQVYTKAGSQPWRVVGLVSAIVGTTGAPLAFLGVLTTLPRDADDRETRESKERLGKRLLVASVALTAIGITGWIMFGALRTRMASRSLETPRVSWGIGPAPNGGVFGLSGSF